MITAQKHRSKR